MLGAGAVGGYTAAKLAQAGHQVAVIEPWQEHADAIRRSGLVVREPDGMIIRARLPVFDLASFSRLNLQGSFDIVILALKSYDSRWAAFCMGPLLSQDGVVLTVQNGVNETELALVLGRNRVLGCVVALLSAELTCPGEISRTTPLGGEAYVALRIGEIQTSRSPRTAALAEIMSCVDSAGETDDLIGERWSKLVVNVMRNALSAAAGLSGNQRDLDPLARSISLRLGGEAISVAQAAGHRLTDVAGLAPSLIVAASKGDLEAATRVAAHLAAAAQKRDDRQRPSMAQDLAKGRRTEIRAINGRVSETGRANGVPTPVNDLLIALVQAMERNQSAPRRDYLQWISERLLCDINMLQC